MTQISLTFIVGKFSDLLNNKVSRESVSKWAYETRLLIDDIKVQYLPIEDEEKIWKAILFLEGIDLLDSPTEYLHNTEDIKDYLSKIIIGK